MFPLWNHPSHDFDFVSIVLPSLLRRAVCFSCDLIGTADQDRPPAPPLMDERKSAFVLDLLIFSISSSMASTVDNGLRTFRNIQIRVNSSFVTRSSSLRVAERL